MDAEWLACSCSSLAIFLKFHISSIKSTETFVSVLDSTFYERGEVFKRIIMLDLLCILMRSSMCFTYMLERKKSHGSCSKAGCNLHRHIASCRVASYHITLRHASMHRPRQITVGRTLRPRSQKSSGSSSLNWDFPRLPFKHNWIFLSILCKQFDVVPHSREIELFRQL